MSGRRTAEPDTQFGGRESGARRRTAGVGRSVALTVRKRTPVMRTDPYLDSEI